MEFEMKPEVCVNEEPFVSSPEAREMTLFGEQKPVPQVSEESWLLCDHQKSFYSPA